LKIGSLHTYLLCSSIIHTQSYTDVQAYRTTGKQYLDHIKKASPDLVNLSSIGLSRSPDITPPLSNPPTKPSIMGITDLPAAVATAVADTLAGVLGETSIKDDSANSSPATSEPKELAKSESELEDGEIRDSEDGDAEEDDGKVKTVFDDAKKFNVKVSLRLERRHVDTLCRVDKMKARF
jgi:hypothetical protein